MKTRSKSGFTLVEILIVVVILGILAAIVIPQFSEASSEARVSSVKSNLQMVRSQIELYKIQHGDDLPIDINDGTAQQLIDALTNKTLLDGTVDANGTYGPYMQKFPVNAVNDKGGLAAGILIVDDTPDAAYNSADHGWIYDKSTGEFFAVDGTDDMCDW